MIDDLKEQVKRNGENIKLKRLKLDKKISRKKKKVESPKLN